MKRLFAVFMVFCLVFCMQTQPTVTATNNEEENFSSAPCEIADDIVSEIASEDQKEISDSDKLFESISNETHLLDYVDAKQFASKKHIARITEKEDLDTYVFLNEDGTNTMYLMAEKVKYIAADGSIHEKNIKLISRDGKYITSDNNTDVSLSKDSCETEVILDNSSLKITVPGAVCEGIFEEDGNTVTYKDVFGAGIDVRYTPTLSGLKEDIIIERYNGINAFEFRAETDLCLFEDESGYYFAEYETAGLKFRIGRIIAYDAVGNISLGVLEYELTDGGYLIRVTADNEFLSSADTVYPVTVDPTINVYESTDGSSIQDAALYYMVPGANLGNMTVNPLGTKNTNTGLGRTAMRLSGLENNTVFSGLNLNEIKRATLYVKGNGTYSPTQIVCYKMLGEQTWGEYTVTYSNVGTVDGPSGSRAYMSESYWTRIDLKTIMQMWKASNYNSYCLLLTAVDEANTYAEFCSSKNGTTSYRPYVTIDYGDIVIDRLSSSYNDQSIYSTSLQKRMNCYGYAIQVYTDELVDTYIVPGYTLHLNEVLYDYYLQQPGEFSTTQTNNFASLLLTYGGAYANAPFSVYINFVESMMKRDFSKLQLTDGLEWDIEDSSANETVPEGYRKIALVVGNNNGTNENDYHFYMRHDDGTWSHKRGDYPRSDKSITTDVKITDANIDVVAKEEYYAGGEIRYYLIKKSAIVDYYHSNHTNSPATFYDYVPGGNKIEKSFPINGMYNSVKIDYYNDIDFFVFKPSTTGNYGFNTEYTLDENGNSSSTLDVKLAIYDSTGTLMANSSSAYGEAYAGACYLIANKNYFIKFWTGSRQKCTSNLRIQQLY
ncbi:MAG: DNRLRE domain-containing protein [Clostridia bacterium]|nr:DNRLRE domain-containing protein [Clostridia bacterium]